MGLQNDPPCRKGQSSKLTVFKNISFQMKIPSNCIRKQFCHLGNVTKTICRIVGLLIVRSLHMKFEFNWQNGFRVNYVLIY